MREVQNEMFTCEIAPSRLRKCYTSTRLYTGTLKTPQAGPPSQPLSVTSPTSEDLLVKSIKNSLPSRGYLPLVAEFGAIFKLETPHWQSNREMRSESGTRMPGPRAARRPRPPTLQTQ